MLNISLAGLGWRSGCGEAGWGDNHAVAEVRGLLISFFCLSFASFRMLMLSNRRTGLDGF